MNNVTVVKFGGSLAKNEAARQKFFGELAALRKKEPVVLVHGGGPEVSAWLNRLGIESRFVNGLRYTDEAALEVVEMVLSGKVNKGIVAEMERRGVNAVGLSGKDGRTLLCRQVKKLGRVGEPSKADPGLLRTLLAAGYLPVVSSLGLDRRGRTLNVNADAMAMALAVALKARRLMLLTDVPGVLDACKATIPEIRLRDVPALLSAGTVTGGMIPKLKACARSVRRGVKEVWIADGAAGLKKPRGTVLR